MQTSKQVWAAVRAERLALVEDLTGLAPDDWATPSLCAGWDVHDVLAHLVDVAQTTRWQFARRIVAARFDFDADNEAGVDAQRRPDPAQTLAALRTLAGSTATPPAPPVTRLIEEFVHGLDIRRPLGLHRDLPVEPLQDCLAHLVRTGVEWGGGRERATGLRLEATDVDWAAGTGWRVRGSAVALLLALTGRPVRPGELSGPGAELLADRAGGVEQDRQTWLRQTIDEFGWAVQHVGQDPDTGAAAFSYTVGLTALEHPELVMTGMPFGTAQEFLNLAGNLVREGHVFAAGTLDSSLTDEGLTGVIDVEDVDELVGVHLIYGRVRARQLIWADSQGTLPWQPGYRNPPDVQPFLGPLPTVWTSAPAQNSDPA